MQYKKAMTYSKTCTLNKKSAMVRTKKILALRNFAVEDSRWIYAFGTKKCDSADFLHSAFDSTNCIAGKLLSRSLADGTSLDMRSLSVCD